MLPAVEKTPPSPPPHPPPPAHVLGVAKASRTTMSVVLSPVGPYFPTGMRPVSLFVDEVGVLKRGRGRRPHARAVWARGWGAGRLRRRGRPAGLLQAAPPPATCHRRHRRRPGLPRPQVHARAWPGGVGDCKVGGNYAPTILPQARLGGGWRRGQLCDARASVRRWCLASQPAALYLLRGLLWSHPASGHAHHGRWSPQCATARSRCATLPPIPKPARPSPPAPAQRRPIPLVLPSQHALMRSPHLPTHPPYALPCTHRLSTPIAPPATTRAGSLRSAAP